MTFKVAFIILTCIFHIYMCACTHIQEAHRVRQAEKDSHSLIKPHMKLLLTLNRFSNTGINKVLFLLRQFKLGFLLLKRKYLNDTEPTVIITTIYCYMYLSFLSKKKKILFMLLFQQKTKVKGRVGCNDLYSTASSSSLINA